MEFKEILERAVEVKKKYAEFEKRHTGKEWTNSQIMEGFVVDVGDLMRLIMAKEGAREIEGADEKLRHELVDCLWVVLVLASKYNIDLEKDFFSTMDELDKRTAE